MICKPFWEFIALLLGANIIQLHYSDERNTDHLFLQLLFCMLSITL